MNSDLENAMQLLRNGEIGRARLDCERILAATPDDPAAVHLAGLIEIQAKRFDAAIERLRAACALEPESAQFRYNLGEAYRLADQPAPAAEAYRAAIATDPGHPKAHLSLAMVLLSLQRAEEAIEAARAAVERHPEKHKAYNVLGMAHSALLQHDEAAGALEEAVKLKPDYVPALANLGVLLANHERYESAEPLLERAVASGGASQQAVARWATIVQPLPQSQDEISSRRRTIAERIDYLRRRNFKLDVTNQRAYPMFLLAYHGMDDRALQENAAELYQAPQPSLPARRRGERIRIGFISTFFRDHTIARLNYGLIANISRERFEVIVLTTERSGVVADEQLLLGGDLPTAREQIAAANLDVLFYTDIGMDSLTYTLAMSRLAPRQMTTWGHPVTSGLKTIDYFISSGVLDPPNAESQYTEKLVRLNDLAVCYDRPARMEADRKRFALPDDANLYICPQTLFKFHPDFDPVLAEILRRDPRGRIVLLDTHPKLDWQNKLLRRFARANSDVADRLLFLPFQDRAGYLTLLATADVMLDPLHFGGGNTSYEAFAMGTPIVTLPTQFLRGRITLAQYSAMGMSDCVVSSPQEYVELAVRLGTDRDFRREISRKIDECSPVLYGNLTGVRQFEDFLLRT